MRVVVPLVLALALSPGVALAVDQDPAQAAFVKRVVEAIDTRDPARQQALVHPKCVCTGVEPLSVFNSPMGRPARTIPRAYRWDLRDAPPGPPMFSDKLDYPVQPTHLLQIDYETGPTSAQTFVIQTARDAGRWYVVAACPKPATVVEMEAAKKARAEQESKLSALVAGMSPELKRRVLDLLGQGQKIGAIRLYEREAGVDLTTAKGVVDRLAQEGR